MRILILMADSNGGFPVPAVRGGATETFVEHLVSQNQKKHLVELEIVSFYDKAAVKAAEKYTNSVFRWIKVPAIIRGMDKFLYFLVKTFFKKKKAVSYKTIFSLLYYIFRASRIIRKETFDKVVIENNIPLAWAIKLSKYKGQYYYHFHNIPRISAKTKKPYRTVQAFFVLAAL